MSASVGVGVLATLDPTTLRPGAWSVMFYALLGAGAATAVCLSAFGGRLTDRGFGVVLGFLMVLVVLSVLANQNRSGGALNVVLLLPSAVFAAVYLPRSTCRAVMVVLTVCIGVTMRAVTSDPVQWLTLVALPLLSFLGTTEVVLRLRSQLADTVEALQQQSLTDPLTGLLNRRALQDRFAADARTDPGITTVVMLDIDRFKSINDTLGHAVGDEVLRRFGAGLAAETREDDVVVRLGGEEFLVMSRTRADRAEQFAETLRVRAAHWMTEWSVTVSVGVVTVEHPRPHGLVGASLEAAVRAADGCLYVAKENGRDRVVMTVWPDPHPASDVPSGPVQVSGATAEPPVESPPVHSQERSTT